jgi:hypothetical protein
VRSLAAELLQRGSNVGVISSFSTRLISTTFFSFFSIVFSAFIFFISNMRVPAASSTMLRISGGFMFKTRTNEERHRLEEEKARLEPRKKVPLVILPCMIKK